MKIGTRISSMPRGRFMSSLIPACRPAAKTQKVELCPTEYEEQKALVKYLESIHVKFTSIPNSTYTKSFAQKSINTSSGLRPGFPDLVVIVGGKLIFIEMKRTKKSLSTVSADQKAWHQALRDAGQSVHVCYGYEAAKKVVDFYIQP